MSARAPAKTTDKSTAKSSGRSSRLQPARSASPRPVASRPVLPSISQLPRSGASQLPQPVRGDLSARFGQDLEGVRLHRGAAAEAGASQVAAKAYTVGDDVVIGASAPPLDTHAGKKVLAHEVAHVVQQRRGGPPPAMSIDAGHERSADRAAGAFVSGAATIDAGDGTAVGIARDADDDEKKRQGKRSAKAGGKSKNPPKSKKPGKAAPQAPGAGKKTKKSAKASPVAGSGGQKPPKVQPGVDPDIDKGVERSFIEEDEPQPAPKSPRPARRPSNKAAKDARKDFNKQRDKHADRLSVGKGGQVHHGVEVQVLKRYPGAFTKAEINDPSNMRGIKPENEGKRQLHNSKIREVWDRHYVKLDGLIKQNGLKKGTAAYDKFVREYLLTARSEMDHNYGAFWSEKWAEQTGKVAQATPKSKSKSGAKKTKASGGGSGKSAAATGAAKKKSATPKSTRTPAATAVASPAKGGKGKKTAPPSKAPTSKKAAAASKDVQPKGARGKADASPKSKKKPAATAPAKSKRGGADKKPPSGDAPQPSKDPKGKGKPARQPKPAPKTAAKADVKKTPAITASPGRNPPGKPPQPTANKSLTSKPAVSKPAVRTALPHATKGASLGSSRVTSRPNARLSAPPGGLSRAATSRPAFGSRFSGGAGYGRGQAAANIVGAIAVPIINHYFQEHFAEEVQQDARRVVSEAIEARRPDYDAAIEAHRQEIEAAQAEGKRVRLHIVVDTTWQDTTDPESGINLHGSVLMNAKVARFEVLHEGEAPKPYTREKRGGILGDVLRFVVGNEQTFEEYDIELEGTNEEVRAFNNRMRAVENALGDPPMQYEELIIRALHGDVSPSDVREYAAYRRELAGESSDAGLGPAMAAHWGRMEALMDGPLDQLIAHAKEKGINLDQLRAYAVKQRDVAGLAGDGGAGPHAAAYWSEVIQLIDGH